MSKTYRAAIVVLILQCMTAIGMRTPSQCVAGDNFATENLVAWCIVPFDASRRTPQRRAAMLQELGIKRSAYDWRQQHVDQFEDEILAYKQHGIDFFAFWGVHDKAFELFEKHNLQPQIWVMMKAPEAESQNAKVAGAATNLQSIAKRTAELGCKLGLYNHGGWAGEPENMVAVCRQLRKAGHSHVGIVYNWHHGHGHIADWNESLQLMLPYLHCLNINGMNTGANPKILAPGKGEHDADMLQAVYESGYAGPIGILDHQPQRDTKEVLQENLTSLTELLNKVDADSRKAASQSAR